MTHRCNHCQAENLVADAPTPGAPAPMCMRCGQPMQPPGAPAGRNVAPAPALPAPAGKLPSSIGAPDAASEFEGSTVMVMRPEVKRAHASGAAAPGGAGAAANEEAWYALIDGAQQGPHTLMALRHAFGEKRLHGGTLLWRAGMAAWTPLDNLPEVRAALAAPQDAAAQAQAAQAMLNLVAEEVDADKAPGAGAAAAAPTPVPAAAQASGPRVQPTRVAGPPRRRAPLAMAAAGLLVAAAAVGLVVLRTRPAAEVAQADARALPATDPVAPATPPPANVAAQVTSAATPPPAAPAGAASATPSPTGTPAAAPSSQPSPGAGPAPAPPTHAEAPPAAELERPPEHDEAPSPARHHGRRGRHGRHRAARH